MRDNKAIKFVFIMMIALLVVGFVGNGMVHAEGNFIDQTPINGEFKDDLAGTSTTKEKGFLEKAGDWLSDTWDFIWEGAKDLAAGIWQEICDLFAFIASIVMEFIGFVVMGLGVLLTWGIFKGEKNAFTDMFQRLGEYLTGIDHNNPYGKLSDVKATDQQLAHAADLVYQDNIMKAELERRLGEGWELGTEKVNSLNGLQAITFVNENTKEVIVAFRGTEEGGDYVSDAILAIGLDSYVPQSGAAKNFFDQVAEKYKGYQLVATGHSLGGYIANEVGMTYRVPTVAFNAPGKNLYPNINASLATGYAGGAGTYAINMSDYRNRRQSYNELAGNYDGLIRNYNSNRDLVGAVGYRPGETYVVEKGTVTPIKRLDNIIVDGVKSSVTTGPLATHVMSNFTGEVDGKSTSNPINSIYDKNKGNIAPRK
ncbi:Protein of unknown function [Thermoactinomyces sp. DSM 45891]|uniref:DUF2974 domain-containing protein n=1 Tax=Thermoactinomyces sp. DSM 45891 TaxID=1761907 RepID=UPI0009221A34|nr:DUF2974 domain-containing protein [Thermoactinomyces sp. DSM 45891]SFW98660.1 Protein of unknown function [Thermoactinomyces sp. DSM 45891]